MNKWHSARFLGLWGPQSTRSCHLLPYQLINYQHTKYCLRSPGLGTRERKSNRSGPFFYGLIDQAQPVTSTKTSGTEQLGTIVVRDHRLGGEREGKVEWFMGWAARQVQRGESGEYKADLKCHLGTQVQGMSGVGLKPRASSFSGALEQRRGLVLMSMTPVLTRDNAGGCGLGCQLWLCFLWEYTNFGDLHNHLRLWGQFGLGCCQRQCLGPWFCCS